MLDINFPILLLLFSTEVLVMLSLILKMCVSIVSNEGPDQTALLLAKYRDFCQLTGVGDHLLY